MAQTLRRVKQNKREMTECQIDSLSRHDALDHIDLLKVDRSRPKVEKALDHPDPAGPAAPAADFLWLRFIAPEGLPKRA